MMAGAGFVEWKEPESRPQPFKKESSYVRFSHSSGG